MSEPDFDAVFSRIPQLQEFKVQDFSIEPLAGYTNRNYRVYNRRCDWILRIPRTATNRFIDRDAEAHNQQLACQLGLAPQAVWRDADGFSLTPTLTDSRALCRADLVEGGTLGLCTEALRMLHHSDLRFHGQVNLGTLLEAHYALLQAPDRLQFSARMARAQELLEQLPDIDLEAVPSHNDLVLENLLLDDSSLHIIDWEYSAMASPYWDLATLCNEARFDHEQSSRFLRDYCAGDRSMKESALFMYRELLQLLSDCWMRTHAC